MKKVLLSSLVLCFILSLSGLSWGVEKVDVKFFPFWVNTVPDNDAKITVEFTVDESS